MRRWLLGSTGHYFETI